MTNNREVLAIGDVHGHADRLRALLEQEGQRGRDAFKVQLGDLGHFGPHTVGGDREAWQMAYEGALDLVLWGNHDRAAFYPSHMFNGYGDPAPETKHMMSAMRADGRLRLAYSAHGWLMTHAGLHPHAKQVKGVQDAVDLTNPDDVAQWLNAQDENPKEMIDMISPRRGGWGSAGGVLWRDVAEKLWDKFPQVFGHSASHKHVVRGEADSWYCVDIGGKGDRPSDDCLAGIYLPSQEIVRVDLA